MEDHKDELILILAGYQKEMENFIQTNPGLRSRFPIHIEFPDYDQQELIQIAEQMCAKRQYRLTDASKLTLIKMLLESQTRNGESFGNARSIRNIIERGIRKQAVRLIPKPTLTRQELMTIEPVDLMEVN